MAGKSKVAPKRRIKQPPRRRYPEGTMSAIPVMTEVYALGDIKDRLRGIFFGLSVAPLLSNAEWTGLRRVLVSAIEHEVTALAALTVRLGEAIGLPKKAAA